MKTIWSSALGKLLESLCEVAQRYADRFFEGSAPTNTFANVISTLPRFEGDHLCRISTDPALADNYKTELSQVFITFCSQVVERLEDFFQTCAPVGLSEEKREFIQQEAKAFLVNHSGKKIHHPFSLEFPWSEESGALTLQEAFIKIPQQWFTVRKYDGVALCEGGCGPKRQIFLTFPEGLKSSGPLVALTTHSTVHVRLACTAYGSRSQKVQVEAELRENERGRQEWVLLCLELIEDGEFGLTSVERN